MKVWDTVGRSTRLCERLQCCQGCSDVVRGTGELSGGRGRHCAVMNC